MKNSSPHDFNNADTALSKLPALSKKRTLFSALSILFFILMLSLAVPAWLEIFAAWDVLFSAALLCIVLGVACRLLKRRYHKKAKAIISTYITSELLAEHFELLQYDPLRFFFTEELKVSKLGGWHWSKGNDFFQACYRGVHFRFSDIKLQYFSLLSLKINKTDTVFRGQWLILDLHKELPTSLMVSDMEEKGAHSRILTEHKDFDRAFMVLTEQPDIVPQVLTPGFMDFLLKPRNSISPRDAKHLFFTTKAVHIAISTGEDLFEPCRKTSDMAALRERITSEISMIKEIIDGFSLTEVLFSDEQSE